ncbi:MAG: hypothetical protein EOO01_40905 [Chitinophagaceae bacterium]|nr:MAG: hypothetical protein EOO01_40905 [Chitinophagaceae bacterium]
MITCEVSVVKDAIEHCDLLAGRYVGENKSILLYNFKQWLTGTHHHCSEKYLQGYVNEFFFKLSFCKQEDMIWHRLIEAMVHSKPYFITRVRRERISEGSV